MKAPLTSFRGELLLLAQAEQWSVPLNFMVTKLLKVGEQRLSVGGGVRYWADSPPSGPHDWGLRLVVTLPFPK